MLKNNLEVEIRKVEKEDAQSIIDFYNVVGGETDFLSFGKNEFKKEREEYEAYIGTVSKEENSIMLLAKIDSQIVSIATINSSQKERTMHVGTLGIVISEKYTGLGLGRILMNELIEFTKQNGITQKISLVTREDNVVAIELYKKLGFEVEGVFKKDNMINGQYYDTIAMGLFI
ncbi:GNAT family N-acetyltransferase [Fictibacillus barbaricus]|nr:GNAT family N-acetyltransferase [Fictibacillus barbaricus]